MSNVSIVMYHYVRDIANSRYPKIKALDYGMFKQQIEFLKQNFDFITMEELIASFDESYQLPEKAVLLTFDDGYIDHYTYVMPVLRDYGIQGSFFIPGKTFAESALLDVNKIHLILAGSSTQSLLPELFKQLDYYRGKEFDFPSNEELYKEYAIANRFDTKETVFIKRILQTSLPKVLRSRIASNLLAIYGAGGFGEAQIAKEMYMNYDQIKCMKHNGMYVGLHGYDHYWLGNLTKQEVEVDVNRALECLSGIVDEDSWVMNYPYGSVNEMVIDCIKQKKCKLGLTTVVKKVDISLNDRFQLPRLDTNDFPPKSQRYLSLG